MKNYLKVIFIVLLAVLIIYFSPNIKQYFGTRFMNAQRNIYEENYSYVRGTIEHIERLKLEYETADNKSHKLALRQTILMTISSFDIKKLPNHLYIFINDLRREK